MPNAGVRSTVYLMAGNKAYVELTTTSSEASQRWGLATNAWPLTTQLGSTNNGIGVSNTGAVFMNNTQIGSLASAPTANGRLDLAIDNSAAKKIWGRVTAQNGSPSPWGPLTASTVSGSQQAGSQGPLITGPASATTQAGNTVAITNITASDTLWPGTPAAVLDISATNGTIGFHGAAGTATSYHQSSNQATVLSLLTGLTFTPTATSGSGSIAITITDANSIANTLTIPVNIVPVPSPETGDGGMSFATIASGNLYLAAFASVVGDAVTANFGATAWADLAPAGYADFAVAALGVVPAPPTAPTSGSEQPTSLTLSWTPG